MTFPLLSLIAMTGSVSSFEEKGRVLVILLSLCVQVKDEESNKKHAWLQGGKQAEITGKT